MNLGIALQLTNILRDVAATPSAAASTCRRRICARFGVHRGRSRAPGGDRGASASCWRSRRRARATSTRAAASAAAARRARAGGGRDHGARSTARLLARIERARLRRLLAAHPRAAARGRSLIAARHVVADAGSAAMSGLTSSSSAPALPASARRCGWPRPARACSSSRSAGGSAAAPPRLPTRRPARSSTTASTRCLAAITRPSRSCAPIGADDGVALDERLDIEIVDRGGARSRARHCPPWPPPLHLVGGLLRWSALGLRDRVAALRMRPGASAAGPARRPTPRATATGRPRPPRRG